MCKNSVKLKYSASVILEVPFSSYSKNIKTKEDILNFELANSSPIDIISLYLDNKNFFKESIELVE